MENRALNVKGHEFSKAEMKHAALLTLFYIKLRQDMQCTENGHWMVNKNHSRLSIIKKKN